MLYGLPDPVAGVVRDFQVTSFFETVLFELLSDLGDGSFPFGLRFLVFFHFFVVAFMARSQRTIIVRLVNEVLLLDC